MNENEIKESLAKITHDRFPFGLTGDRCVFCIKCGKSTKYGVVSAYIEDRDLFNAGPYLNWTYKLRYKDDKAEITPSNEIRWFCSVDCLAEMIYENQLWLLEEMTKA